MFYILSDVVLNFENDTDINSNRKDSILRFCHIFGQNNALKDLADPPNFSPEIGATETLKKSPETAETMASLESGNLQVTGTYQVIVPITSNLRMPTM